MIPHFTLISLTRQCLFGIPLRGMWYLLEHEAVFAVSSSSLGLLFLSCRRTFLHIKSALAEYSRARQYHCRANVQRCDSPYTVAMLFQVQVLFTELEMVCFFLKIDLCTPPPTTNYRQLAIDERENEN